MNKYQVIFFTGAGISFQSGIPTFQSQPGIRDKLVRSFVHKYPEEYRETIRGMVEACDNAEPNEAHKAIAEAGFPVITMNIDRLHTKAGSKDVVEVHGVLPTKEVLEKPDFPQTYTGIVLYEDAAPEYATAQELVDRMGDYDESYFIVVGTSFYTGISSLLPVRAKMNGANVIRIDSDAAKRVPEICDLLKRKLIDGEDIDIDAKKLSDPINWGKLYSSLYGW